MVEKKEFEKSLKDKILELLYDAEWNIEIAGTTQDAFIEQFNLEHENSVIEDLIKLIREGK